MNMIRVVSGLLLCAGASLAQQYVISTVAGGAPPPVPAAALTTSTGLPQGLATDAAGNLYFASNNCVFKLELETGVLTRVAGNSRQGYSGDGGPATNAQFRNPLGVAVDRAGNLFIADTYNNRIRKVSANGNITTMAGNGTQGFSGDNGPAASAQLNLPQSVALDGLGNIILADVGNHRLRKVSANGIITTLAGNGGVPGPGDGGSASNATLNYPASVAVDASGNLFIADMIGQTVRRISPDGVITTVAGNGTPGFSGDGGPGVGAQLQYPQSIAVDTSGNLFIADAYNFRVRKLAVNGIITTVAGNGLYGIDGDGGPAINAQLLAPWGVAVDAQGNLFIGDAHDNRIRRVSTDGTITTVAGNGLASFSGDGGFATSAQMGSPESVAVDGSGNVFVVDGDNNRIRKVSTSGTITTVAGSGSNGYSGDGGLATNAQMDFPMGVAVDGAGNLFIADYGNDRVRRVSANGIMTTVAGNGTLGFSGDGGPAGSAQLLAPWGVAADALGNLFIADAGNNRIRKVSADGIITTVAGDGSDGFSGDDGPATKAQLSFPESVAIDGAGSLLIADEGNDRIRKVWANGVITTVAGNGINGFSGDGGLATSAQLRYPSSVAVDAAGNFFIADMYNNRIRRVSASGVIDTVAGNGVDGYSGDGGPAVSAQLGHHPGFAAVDGSGNLYVADAGNNAIRLLKRTNQDVLIGAVVDAASESAAPVSPGKIVVIYGAGLGPVRGTTASPANGAFATQLSGTTVSFDGVAAPIVYTSATQVIAIVPYSAIGSTTNVSVAFGGQISSAFSLPLAASSPSLFTSNQTGAGLAAAVNAGDGTANSATNPVKIGGYLSLYATGEGQSTPAGVDGKLGITPAASPNLAVTATIGGVPAVVQYRGGVAGDTAGLMQVNVQIPLGVRTGGYVPVVLRVGNASTVDGAVWIAVSN